MTDVLKGNFTAKNKVETEKVEASVEERFEREAKKHLGGSIAFVAKKRVKWEVKDE